LGKKLLRNYDYVLLLTIVLISAFGVIMVGSSSVSGEISISALFSNRTFVKQLVWAVGGLVGMALLSFIDYSEWQRLKLPIYFFSLALLILVIFKGTSAGGAQRWIAIGKLFNLQPSELAKIAIIITLSATMAKEGRSLERWSGLIVPLLHVAVPMLVIFLQPDLGTSLIFMAITGAILFVAGMRWLHLAVMGVGGIIGSVLAFLFVLKPYQKSRLIIFRDPWQDPFDDGWQIIQSKVAVGSGQFRGRGLFKGTQTQLDFLPEKNTDFIFSVIGEELGFLGASIFLLVYVFLIWRVLKVAMEAKDSFGRYLCVGVAAMLSFQLLVNVGMTISIMPVTGLPLPLISYGGSSFLTTMISLGLVLSVAAHKDTSIF
jgi:rod shape determining protein RodA